MRGLFVAMVITGVLIGLLSSVSVWIPVAFLVIGAAVIGVMLTQARQPSGNISIKTSGPAQVDVTIGGEQTSLRRSVFDPPPPYVPPIMPPVHKMGPCPKHECNPWGPHPTAGELPVIDAAEPEAPLVAPIMNDVPGLIGYVQRNGRLEPIMDPEYKGSPSIFPTRPGGEVDHFPGPYASTSDVVAWAEKRGELEFRRQQRLDRYGDD
jgi:hypothetical protein